VIRLGLASRSALSFSNLVREIPQFSADMSLLDPLRRFRKAIGSANDSIVSW
jgi:hypothetical protein